MLFFGKTAKIENSLVKPMKRKKEEDTRNYVRTGEKKVTPDRTMNSNI